VDIELGPPSELCDIFMLALFTAPDCSSSRRCQFVFSKSSLANAVRKVGFKPLQRKSPARWKDDIVLLPVSPEQVADTGGGHRTSTAPAVSGSALYRRAGRLYAHIGELHKG
jgi:hypothetical protein